MGRLLAIDYGKARTGIAVTDPQHIIATPLNTIPTPQLLPFLVDYARQEEVERFVVGMPLQTDGTPSENMARVRPFVGRLHKLLPDIPIDLYDERYTTILAHQALHAAGKSTQSLRRDKGLIDKVSACILLQDYIRSQTAQNDNL